MVNKLKLYWPMVISFSLMIIFGFLVGVIFLNDGIIVGDSSMILLVMFTFLLVVSTYVEMLGFNLLYVLFDGYYSLVADNVNKKTRNSLLS